MHLTIRRAVMALLLALSVAGSLGAADTTGHENLVNRFVEVFNSGEFASMSAFYRDHASDSFNNRRTSEESLALHEKLVDLLGQLTVESIEEKHGKVQLLAASSRAGGTAEVRFDVMKNPPLIESFSVGVRTANEGAHHGGEAELADSHAPSASEDDGPFGFLVAAEDVYQTQIFAQPDGSLLLIWVQRGLYSLDLFAARLGEEGVFSHPVRINQRALNRYIGDEARPGVAIGPDGAVAVVWTADNNDIMLAVGAAYGLEFDAPVKLNQDVGRAERTMPTVAFGPEGAPHAVWLDPRDAPAGMEEPSNLYHATLHNGAVLETNLTARQKTSVCGCCRPFIAFDAQGQCNIAFRNVSAAGFRDIWRISGPLDALGDPEPTSPPIWKLGGCPSAGPIVSDGGTLWKDASTGDWRVLWATDPSAQPAVLFAEDETSDFTAPPRPVSGEPSWILVGAKPSALLATLAGDDWQVLRADLPAWATSAAVHDGELILVGNVRGRLQTAAFAL